MSTAKKAVAESETPAVLQRKRLFAIEPWRYRVLDDSQTAVIEAYVEAAGTREEIARILQSRWIDAERTARFITDAVNAQHEHHAMVMELCSALELCLASDGLTWEAEFEAEAAVKHAKQGAGN
ncbi:MAG TPA: hypothetical protein VHX61_05435 [Rhizomicrobium sp.]|jgi:hypothetical protein|nr:hypothetical protein [Rhizomicrobium sp.]